jgi:hypothetical protein
MPIFDKALSDEFVAALRALAQEGGWWRDVLADKTLLIALRGKHLNVYWQGQSLFDVAYIRGEVNASTHPKYLIDPNLSAQVSFDGFEFKWSKSAAGALIATYDETTLGKMKRAASVYADGEKRGVHAIAMRNPNIVDVEIVFPATEGADSGKLPRADIATFERHGPAARLVFWEAKLFQNSELRAHSSSEPPVLAQVAKYKKEVALQRDTILESYRKVASNLVAIAEMGAERRFLDPLIRDVAEGRVELTLGDPPDVGVVIYDFDAAQRDDAGWRAHLSRIEAAVGKVRVKAAGDPKHIRL